MSDTLPSLRSFLAGNSGVGKSTRAWQLYLTRFPRRLLIDQTGEWEEPNPGIGYPGADQVAYTVPGAIEAIRRLAPKGKWTVALGLDPAELPELIDWLIPVPNLKDSPVRAMGGAVLLVDEVDLLAPQGYATEPVRTLYRRSRHVGLSVVSTTQRPSNVSREVTAQCWQVMALHLSEPRDRDYMVDLMRMDLALLERWARWTRNHPHGGLWKDLRTGRLLWAPERGPLASGDGDPSPASAARGAAAHAGSDHRPGAASPAPRPTPASPPARPQSGAEA